MRRRRMAIAAISVSLAASLFGAACGGDDASTDDDPAVPEERTQDSQLIVEGQRLYEQSCALCHGSDLMGTETGPPFLSPIYAPNHHPDEAFYAAVTNGVQPHHWDFGPMPAQPSVSSEDVAAIVAYVRAKQIEAGITEDPSHP